MMHVRISFIILFDKNKFILSLIILFEVMRNIKVIETSNKEINVKQITKSIGHKNNYRKYHKINYAGS